MTTVCSRRAARVMGCLMGALLLTFVHLKAQDPDPVEAPMPKDDITDREAIQDHLVLPYQPIREADILWERRIWRMVDVREKMNLPFTAPESPLFKIFSEAALAGSLPVYSTEDDKFSKRMTEAELRKTLFRRDTLVVSDPVTYVETIRVVENEFNWENVKRFKIKEVWFFDTKTSALRNRILGIAPIVEERDENGNFRFEKPLFWVYYPEARATLAKHKAITHGNNASAVISWEDLFEKRYFASYITKQNNVRDLRLQDLYTGLDLLLESDKIKSELFAREHDAWTY